MKYLFLGSILLLSTLYSFAQRNLSGSMQGSHYTYVYRLAPREADALRNRNGFRKAAEKYLHSLTDSFPAGAKIPALQPGNYLLLNARGDQMKYRLYTTPDLNVKTISNAHDLSVAVHSKQGALISDATVMVKKKKLTYQPATNTYGVVKPRREGEVRVYYNNTSYAFPMQKNRTRRPFLRNLPYSFPLKYMLSPFRHKQRADYNGAYFTGPVPYEKGFRGFMAFNKPKYKPGDTVFLKAFVETASGKLVNRPLLLRLSTEYFDTDTILAVIQPYRPGGYTYQLVLSDSLDIDLDEEYLLTLEEERSRKYDLEEYDGDLDEDAYAIKRKVLMRGKFEYEEYELEAVTFQARSSQATHCNGEQLSIFLKAADENGMAVMDGRVNIVVKTGPYSAHSFYAPRAFLPDTLWTHSQTLESIGDTKVLIPDSIFPPADFNYVIECSFLNTSNELQTKNLQQTYRHNPESISFTLQRDSLAISYQLSGKAVTRTGMLYITGKSGDTIQTRPISMPALVKVNPFAAAYKVSCDGLRDEYQLHREEGMISCLSLMTYDTVEVQLVNPRRLHVWYTIFAGNKIVLKGYGDSLNYREKITKPGNYYVSLQYIYAGQVYNKNYSIPYKDRILNIHTDQPASVYPGQQLRIGIHVTDYKGDPVPGADITAYGYTGKFKANAPAIPYLGKNYPARRWYQFPDLQAKETMEHQAALDWQRWSRELQLDTVEYYKFLHPEGIYINREPAADNITQVAPFVVNKGKAESIQLLYIDEVPVFYLHAQQVQRYSFRVTEGRHNIRLRTLNQLITIDSVWVTKGMKTFLSVDVNVPHKHVKVTKMPHQLSKYELQLWSKYMLLINNNFGENFAYIHQEPNYTLLHKGSGYYPSAILAGPFGNKWASLVVKNKFKQPFEAEGSWEYTISKGLIRQKQFNHQFHLPTGLLPGFSSHNFRDFVLTEKEIDSLWQDYLDIRSYTADLFLNNTSDGTGNGWLRIGPPVDTANKKLFVKNIILFRYDNPDFIAIYPGSRTDLGNLPPGDYRLLFLLKRNRYIIKDSVTILPDGTNYYSMENMEQQAADSTSIRIARIIEQRALQHGYRQGSYELDEIKETFNEQYLNPATFAEVINGVVLDEFNTPLPGVTIHVKGTKVGTLTDKNGKFSLRAPSKGTIVISFIGYVAQEIKVGKLDFYRIQLTLSNFSLQEVVVSGYGVKHKRSLTGAVTREYNGLLQGKVAGVIVRGVNTNSVNSQPLIIVDGLPYNGSMADLDKTQLANVDVLEGDEAIAMFGERAAAGVIVVTTNKMAPSGNPDVTLPGNTLRHNFRDHAYWQPALLTDANGNASFQVTFPDDITSWRTFVIAMNGKRQSGILEQRIQSFKALSGNISLPQFAIAGDTMHVIGKTLNYLSDSIAVKRTFSVNNTLFKEDSLHLRNSWIDTFAISAGNPDSLKLKYTVQRSNGYFDGEERAIPVYPQGVPATSGMFAPLYRDTTFQLSLPPDTSAIQLYAETSLLPVWYEEAENIHRYEYYCNEQLASKLKALLAQKKIDRLLQRPFKNEKHIRELIKQLGQGKSQTGLWGWWANTHPSTWISLHVIEALMEAEKNGYPISIDRKLLTDYLIYNLDSYHGTEKIAALHLLRQLGAQADFKSYITAIEKSAATRSLYEQLRLAELKQQLNLPLVLDTFIRKQQHTMFGNTYWGEDGYLFFDNAIQNTLCMYRMLKRTGGYDDLLQRTLAYLLEQRKSGHWRNTYEASLILETILPDLLDANHHLQPATLSMRGGEQMTITSFPFSKTISNNETLSISKQGSMPVYFTAYRRYRDPHPAKLSGNFEVSSSFEQNGQPLGLLKAGAPVMLKVTVHVKADADYVMVEIPIPAGCSYRNKMQSYGRNEVHREYFKNKVSIFCSSLRKGKHVFTVSLLPRYTGVYTLNPARAEMMYFPIFNGREAIKKVHIE
ncbi:carboxypeptidase-like regulatory domain-containing protein [uncultured Chitinophaga sp.]|jgi:Large extracellular alpha-helical protein|uniref:carboxypeptidase-like regulatory domain-containing protein n=1 Tax=uncultured Chitinophaga sp. TaxID=339340 RepID=UPI0026126ACE|nr:carboxypeptidase-like regulatory domain-containing protein [uncultured Chitinophaga sp.]